MKACDKKGVISIANNSITEIVHKSIEQGIWLYK